jgi:hypothetical protein
MIGHFSIFNNKFLVIFSKFLKKLIDLSENIVKNITHNESVRKSKKKKKKKGSSRSLSIKG